MDQPGEEGLQPVPPDEPSDTPPTPGVDDTGPDGPPTVPGAAGGPAGAPTPERPRRRWPWVLTLLLTLGVAGAALAVAVDQRDVAATWQEQALALEEQRDDAVDRGEAVAEQLDELRAAFETSEADVTALEARVRELADEKAQAEDTATTVRVERDVFADLSAQIADATAALDQCVSRLFELQQASVDAFNRSAAGEPVDVEPLNAQAREVTDFCNEARSAAAAASTAAARLGDS